MFAYGLGDGAQLRPLEPWQAPELAATVDTAREHLAPWTVLASRVVNVDTARNLLQHYADEQARDGGRYLGIWNNGQLVGGAIFRAFDTRSGMCEIGGWLIPQAQGHGLATRSFRHMIDWAIHERGIHRVELHTSPANDRGRALGPRLGMTREAVLRDAFELNGQRHDSEVWAVLATAWNQSQPPASPEITGTIDSALLRYATTTSPASDAIPVQGH